MDTTFDYGNIRILQTYSPLGKHVDVMLNHGDHWEIISAADPRAHDAFIALHNSKGDSCRAGGQVTSARYESN